MVTAVEHGAVTIHVYLPSPKFNAYQPTWELSNGKVEKRKKQLDGAKPYTIPVDRSQIIAIATGTWNDGKISENLTKFLIERGILTDAVATGPSHLPDGTAITHPLVVHAQWFMAGPKLPLPSLTSTGYIHPWKR